MNLVWSFRCCTYSIEFDFAQLDRKSFDFLSSVIRFRANYIENDDEINIYLSEEAEDDNNYDEEDDDNDGIGVDVEIKIFKSKYFFKLKSSERGL